VIPYFKTLDLEPARIAALVFAVLAVAAQFGLHLSDPQLESIKNLVTLLVGFFGAAEATRARSTPVPTAPKPPSVPPAALGLLAFFLVSCTPAAKADVKSALDVATAACAALETQPEPSAVVFTCTGITVADGAAHVFLIRVPKEDAPAFAARTCKPAQGQVSP
jgi:hypothetical protein